MRKLSFGLICAGLLATQASAAIITLSGVLSGANEVPPTPSTATGVSSVTLDTVALTLTVNEIFTGLTGGPAAAAHIHCCGPTGVNEPVAIPFTGFPAATSGTYLHTFDLTSLPTYNGAFVTANGGTLASAQTAFVTGFEAYQSYANIHNATYAGGEVRAQLVPEPATLALAAAGLLLIGLRRRRT